MLVLLDDKHNVNSHLGILLLSLEILNGKFVLTEPQGCVSCCRFSGLPCTPGISWRKSWWSTVPKKACLEGFSTCCCLWLCSFRVAMETGRRRYYLHIFYGALLCKKRKALLFHMKMFSKLYFVSVTTCHHYAYWLTEAPFLFLFEDKFPPSFTLPLSLKSSLRYGENPHQKAAFYVDKSLSEVNAGGIATAIQHHGKVSKFRHSCLQ